MFRMLIYLFGKFDALRTHERALYENRAVSHAALL